MSVAAPGDRSKEDLQVIWELAVGGSVGPLPRGITQPAAEHRMLTPLYRAERDGRCRPASSDHSLLRSAAGYNAHRGAVVAEELEALGGRVDAAWRCWKGAALLMSVSGYHEVFEAADIDIMVGREGVDGLLAALRSGGAEISKDHRDRSSGLGTLQLRRVHPYEVTVVWDVAVVEELPPATYARGVPVVSSSHQTGLMRSHLEKHRGLDGVRLRMVFDARIAGADWADEMCAERIAGERTGLGA